MVNYTFLLLKFILISNYKNSLVNDSPPKQEVNIPKITINKDSKLSDEFDRIFDNINDDDEGYPSENESTDEIQVNENDHLKTRYYSSSIPRAIPSSMNPNHENSDDDADIFIAPHILSAKTFQDENGIYFGGRAESRSFKDAI